MAQFIESGKSAIAVYFDEFNDNPVVHIRATYTDKQGKRGRTRKGVMMTPEVAAQVFQALGDVLTKGPTGEDPFEQG